MRNLVTIPALGCDGGLYADILPRLSGVVEPVTIVADKDSSTGCVQQVLELAPEKFIILGTSFGGRTSLEVAFAAPDRCRAWWSLAPGLALRQIPPPVSGGQKDCAARSLRMSSRKWLTWFPTCPGQRGEGAQRLYFHGAETGWRCDGAAIGGFVQTCGPVVAAWRNHLPIAHAVGAGRQVFARSRWVKNVDVLASWPLCGNFRVRAFSQPGSTGGNRRYPVALAAGQ